MTEEDRPGPSSASGPRPIARGAVLAIIGFLATVVLLFGLANLVGSSRGRTPSPVAAAPSAAARPSPVASGSQGASAPAASPGSDPVLVGAGDIADCGLPDDSATASLIDSIPGTVFTAGDNAYQNGTAAEFSDCYGPTWGRFLDRTRPAAGNHDWGTRDLAGYRGYFGSAAGPTGASWYSYELGAWHVIVLDSDCSSVGGCAADSVQGRWLATDLRASTARCTLAIWHHPRFSSGEHGNDTAVAPFWQALYDAGADVVVNGHDHDYERFAAQDQGGRTDGQRGIREFVVGTGGAALRGFPTTPANTELRSAVVHGVIRFVLHPTTYEWSFVPTSGVFRDSGQAPCHP